MIYLISDTHFFHRNIGKYCSRPSHWQKLIINNWKRIVGSYDTVIHLGDFAFYSRNKAGTERLVRELPGHKILIRGNHDGSIKKMTELGFLVWQPDIINRIVDGYRFVVLDHTLHDEARANLFRSGVGPNGSPMHSIILSHRPLTGLCGPYFYGHVHNNPMPFDDDNKYYQMDKVYGRNICVEMMNYQPVPLPALLGDTEWMHKNVPLLPRSEDGDGEEEKEEA